MPDLSSIRRLTLADLTQETLEQLVRHGEDLLVERKQDLPKPPRFGAAAGSLANTLGGWILLGVADDGKVVGWEKPERVDLQSHLASVLRAEVDPLPPFVADMREVDGKPIAVVRVFPSVDSPHIVRGTGAVYVRSSKGKEPVDDHRTLLDLARRGEDSERLASERLVSLPVVTRVLRPPEVEPHAGVEGNELRFIARAAPLTVTPALTQWCLTRNAAERCMEYVTKLLPAAVGPWAPTGPDLQAFGRAIAAEGSIRTSDAADRVVVVADSGGVMGIEIARGGMRGERRPILLERMLKDEIHPMVRMLATMLEDAEAYGRAVADLWIVRPPTSDIRGQQREAPLMIHVAGELTVPASDEEAWELAQAWHREVQREVGIVKFEGGNT